MARFLLLLSTFFILAFASRDEDYFRQNMADAYKLVHGRCEEYLYSAPNRMDQAFKDLECDSAAKVVSDDLAVKSRQALIDAIDKFLTIMPNEDKFSEEEKARYIIYQKNFKDSPDQVEDIAVGCMDDKVRAKENKAACRAATESLAKKLNIEQQVELAKLSNKEKYVDNYKRYFDSHPEKVDQLLNGRCKPVLQNPWYKFDPSLQDKECEGAVNAKQRSYNKEVTKQVEVVRDRSYFLNNINKAEELSTECKHGKVDNLSECEAAISVISEKSIEESKRADYQTYYSTHHMAAKFFVKWCQSSMLNFNIKCQAAQEAIKNNAGKKPKRYSEKLLAKNIEALKNDFNKVKEILQGNCKTIMEDPWYYLDESIRNEECDAAAEIARLAMEQKDKESKKDTAQ